MPIDAVELNASSASDLGWDPTWFGLPIDALVDDIVAAIKRYQSTAPGLLVDGWAGLSTFRRILSDRVAEGLEDVPDLSAAAVGDSILIGGKLCPINWPNVVTPGELGALVLKGGQGKLEPGREVNRAVIHWPVTLNAATTLRVLNGRNVGTNFEVDWDGTIYQFVDVDAATWHSGIRWINDASVGIDVSNPVGRKWNNKLERLGQPKRPLLGGFKINGWNPGRFLGFHQVQIDALTALLAGLAKHKELPIVSPAAGKNWRHLHYVRKGKPGVVPGIYHHAEVDYPRKKRGYRKKRRSGKWDTAGINLPAVCAAAAAMVAR